MPETLSYEQFYKIIDTKKPSELVKKTSISRQTIYNLKKRIVRPSYATILIFTEVYGIVYHE